MDCEILTCRTILSSRPAQVQCRGRSTGTATGLCTGVDMGGGVLRSEKTRRSDACNNATHIVPLNALMLSLFDNSGPKEEWRGHAARPGTGPDGETCRTCKHPVVVSLANRYWKCGLMRHCWTHGNGTDIRLKDRACRYWERKDDE